MRSPWSSHLHAGHGYKLQVTLHDHVLQEPRLADHMPATAASAQFAPCAGICYGTASCRVDHQLIAVTVEDLWGPCRTVTSCRVFTCACSQVRGTLVSFTESRQEETLQLTCGQQEELVL